MDIVCIHLDNHSNRWVQRRVLSTLGTLDITDAQMTLKSGEGAHSSEMSSSPMKIFKKFNQVFQCFSACLIFMQKTKGCKCIKLESDC